MDRTTEFYSRPSNDFRGGAGFNVFAGSRRQRGGGIFGSLKKFFLPVAKTLGRGLLSQGIGLARDVAQDALDGQSLKGSLAKHGKTRAMQFGKDMASRGLATISKMVGKGNRSARRKSKHRPKRLIRRKPSKKRVRKTKARKPSRKRRKQSKSTFMSHAKRRRTANF